QPMDRSGLRCLFLGAPRASDRLHARPAGVPYDSLHHRLPGAGRAGGGDLQGGLTVGVGLEPFPFRLNRNGGSPSLFDAFSSREPVSTSLENALVVLRAPFGP